MLLTIIPAQIRAARSYLGLTQTELAEKLGVSYLTLSNWKNGMSTIPYKRMAGIIDFFRKHGFIFRADGGFEITHLQYTVYTGEIEFEVFFNKVHAYLAANRSEGLSVMSTSEEAFLKLPFTHDYLQKMHEIKPKVRAILGENDSGDNLISYCEYRTLTNKHFSESPTYIFGNHVAYILWDSMSILDIENEGIAQAQKKLFELAWSHSNPII